MVTPEWLVGIEIGMSRIGNNYWFSHYVLFQSNEIDVTVYSFQWLRMESLNWIESINGLIIKLYWLLSLALHSYCIIAIKELNELKYKQMTIPTTANGFGGVPKFCGDASCP